MISNFSSESVIPFWFVWTGEFLRTCFCPLASSSCVFAIVSAGFSADPARIASGIVAGIGFIGAGIIWAEKDMVKGITTAASLRATAAIGLTVGIADYPLAVAVTALVVTVLSTKTLMRKMGLERHQD